MSYPSIDSYIQDLKYNNRAQAKINVIKSFYLRRNELNNKQSILLRNFTRVKNIYIQNENRLAQYEEDGCQKQIIQNQQIKLICYSKMLHNYKKEDNDNRHSLNILNCELIAIKKLIK